MSILRIAMLIAGIVVLLGEARLFALIARNAKIAGESLMSGLVVNLLVLAILGGSGGGMILLALGLGMPEGAH